MKKNHLWKFIYAFCCLIYMGWVTYQGLHEFDRINGQFLSVANDLDPSRIKAFAIKELTNDCRRQQRTSSAWDEKSCTEWPSIQVEAREKKVKERLIQTEKRYSLKLALFYFNFVVFFLLAPPTLLYLLILGMIKVKKTIKIVK